MIFIGQEARRHFTGKESSRAAEGHHHKHSDGALANQPAACADITICFPFKKVVEPIEKPSQGTAPLLPGPKHQSGERRAEGQGVEGREDHRNRDGHGELLVEPSSDARYENRGHEHRRQNQRDADNRAGNLFHRLQGRGFGRQAGLDVALHSFDHDDGIVYHQADGQHQTK